MLSCFHLIANTSLQTFQPVYGSFTTEREYYLHPVER